MGKRFRIEIDGTELKPPIRTRNQELKMGSFSTTDKGFLSATLMPSGEGAGIEAPAKVLIVDDDSENVEALTLLLAAQGYEVHAVHDGLSALPAVQRLVPDAVLLDIDLPGRDGFDVARRIRGLGIQRRMMLVATTGWSRRVDRETAEVCGFDHFLAKPLDLGLLLEVLKHLKKTSSNPPSIG